MRYLLTWGHVLQNKYIQKTCWSVLALALVFAGKPALASVENVASTEIQASKEGANSQERVNKLDDEKDSLVDKYRAVSAQVSDLKEYNRQLAQIIKSQEEEMTSLTRQIERVRIMDKGIVPLMGRMVEGLEAFVELDTPFLIEKRRGRVVSLKDMLTRSDISQAEKFRRILEAYTTENEYGRKIESYRGKMARDDKNIIVDFLSVGRVALLYQTLDGNETGMWDAQARAWIELDSEFRTPVRLGLRIAREQMAPNLMIIPMRGVN